jgi:hypothetical protein
MYKNYSRWDLGPRVPQAHTAEVPKLWGFPGGRASCFYEKYSYFELNMGSRKSICFGKRFAWLKYFTYRLEPVLAPNYKQHILSSAEVRKVWYSLAELYARYAYFNVFGWGGGSGSS